MNIFTDNFWRQCEYSQSGCPLVAAWSACCLCTSPRSRCRARRSPRRKPSGRNTKVCQTYWLSFCQIDFFSFYMNRVVQSGDATVPRSCKGDFDWLLAQPAHLNYTFSELLGSLKALMFDNRVQKMAVRCPGAQQLAGRCSIPTVEAEPPVRNLHHHKTFKLHPPAWPESRPARASWGFRSRRRRSWGPGPAGWGVLAACPSCWCWRRPGKPAESSPPYLYNTKDTTVTFLLHETSYNEHNVTLHKEKRNIQRNYIKETRKYSHLRSWKLGIGTIFLKIYSPNN